jgi:hypothetical protein
MFDAYTTGDMAHLDTIFKFLPHTHTHTRVNMCASIFFSASMILAWHGFVQDHCRRRRIEGAQAAVIA